MSKIVIIYLMRGLSLMMNMRTAQVPSRIRGSLLQPGFEGVEDHEHDVNTYGHKAADDSSRWTFVIPFHCKDQN